MAISVPTPTGRSLEARVLALAKAVCLIGFPLVPMLVYLSGRHPSLGRGDSFSQIGNLAVQSVMWARVHFALSVGGFFGLAVVLIIRGEVVTRAPQLWTNAAAAVGVIGAVIFTGTVLMEVNVIPALARACTSSPGCRVPDNQILADALADQGWRILPGLTLGGRMLMVGLAMLAVLGLTFGSLRNWEASALFSGSVLEIGTNTGLHQWGNFTPAAGMPGLAAVAILISGLGISWRLTRPPRIDIVVLPDEPPPAESESQSQGLGPGGVSPKIDLPAPTKEDR